MGIEDGHWQCLLCGNSRQQLETSGPDYEYASVPGQFTLSRCTSCGHVSLNPIPPPEAAAALYPAAYYTINPRSPLYLQGFIYKRKIREDIRRILSAVDVPQLRSIVDVGCGDAARLFELRGIAPPETECIGLDLQFQPELVKRARAARIDLVEGSETNLNSLREDAHDLMIMSQILEHLRDPVAVLERLRSKLTRNGLLLVETPNRGGLDYSLFRGRYWGGYHLPRHFHLFTRDSLAQTAKRSGYRIVRQGCLPSPGFWIMSFRNALGLRSSQYSRSVFEFLNFSNILAVGTFTALDLVCITFGLSTSNQYVLLARE
ncbi:MAG TPA: class I SAM-dependent methyltransferase [Terriglobia bacterium]|jgi:ubiquinone/menaquinone biosynthesis C-methylase UbiE